jgi:hypothetical protein
MQVAQSKQGVGYRGSGKGKDRKQFFSYPLGPTPYPLILCRNESPCWIANRFFFLKKTKRLAGSLKREALIQQRRVEAERSRWTFYEVIFIDELVKSQRVDGFVKSSRCKARKN